MSVTKADESKVKITISTNCGDLSNKTLNSLHLNLNKNLLGTEHTISSNMISRIKKITVLFEELEEIILSKSSYKITSFIDFSPCAQMFTELNNYTQKLKADLE